MSTRFNETVYRLLRSNRGFVRIEGAMTDKPSLADLERAVEEAWSAFKPRSISDEVAGRR